MSLVEPFPGDNARQNKRELEKKDGEEKKEENKNKIVGKISLVKLFSFADFWDYILMAFGSVAACVHGAAIPVFFVFFGKIINIAGTAYLFPTLVSRKIAKYSLEFVYLGIVVLFSSWTEVACWMYTGERQAAKMRLACLKSMLSQDISFFDTETSTGEITSAMTSDILVVQDAISEKAGNFIHFITRFITGFIIGFIQLWQISLVTLSIVPLIAVAGGVYAYTFTGLISKIQNSYLKAGEFAEEVISNIRSIKAFVGEEKALKSYSEALAKTYEYGKKGGLVKGMGLGAVLSVIALSWALLVWFGSITIHRGVSNGGETFTTMLNVVFAGLSLGMAAQNIPTFLRARTASYSIFKMIEKNTLNNVNTKNRNGKIPKQIKGDIRFKDVFFSYPSRPEAIILNKFNLNIPSGKIVAIVGGSGSGKSTVISLLERFYEPQFGEILLDNQNIKNLDLKWLRRQIGLVNQEPSLFATTIRENILYGKNDATDDEINRAADLSDSLSFINNLPHKFETHVGERGIQISGGQKQRIAISRAILKDPSILLLDEATSSLDSESEQSVQQALDRVMVGRTTVVVAHRLTTVRNADIIAVISNGHIVESGTHDQLKSNPKSIYANLIHLQQTPAIQPQSAVFSNGNCSQRIGSFRSERDSVSIYPPETEEKFKVRKKVSWSRMYSMASPDWLFGLIGIFSSFISGSLIPLFALAITDALVAYYMDWETTQKEIKRISLLICAGAVVSVASNIMEHLNFGIVGERLTLRVRETMFASILKNEIGWFDNANHSSSTLSSRLATDARLLKTIVVDRSSILMENLSLVVTSFIIAFILNWRVTLVVLATFPLQIAGHLSEKFFIQGYGGNLSKAYLKANMLAGEAVGNIRTVSAFCLEEKIIELYSNELSEPSKHSFRRGQIAGVFYGVAQCSIFCSFGLSLWYGSTLMEKGISSFKSVIKCFMVLTITALGMAETLAMAPDLVKGNHMVASVFEVIDRKTQISEDTGEEVEKIEGNIELKKVGFCYPSRLDVKIFEDFDLKVQAGTSMALVGSSGSGKTSVISLILRFYDPTEGKVLIDGKDIRSLQLKSLRKQIGLVQQEPALFATTIYDNILYGKDDATETEIVEAAKLANAHSFITGLPEGYSTKVGERGVQLSGGQKQRIAIARAVLKDPTILLLDEATSALDMESERVVQKAIENLMMNRTTIAVAHRLSTVKNANLISVLQNGKIVEQGNHEELIQNKNGAYYKLINLQKNEVFS